jgi:hypothetical protein
MALGNALSERGARLFVIPTLVVDVRVEKHDRHG